MSKKDFYKVLGVPENSPAEEIKKAYRRLAMRYHPDRNPGNKMAEEKFNEINEAYGVLSDQQKRSQYDQMKKLGGFDFRAGPEAYQASSGGFEGFEGFGPGGFSFEGFDLGDLFGQFFDRGHSTRQRKYGPRVGEDIYYEVEIPFEQAVTGGKVTLDVPVEESCRTCGGTGEKPGSKSKTCPKCGGRGILEFGQGGFAISRPCPGCYGRGKIVGEVCFTCGGRGQINTTRKIAVNIPAGVDDGTKIRVHGQGKEGLAGGAAGDLILVIRTAGHHFFKRKGSDIYCEVKINVIGALLGTTLKIRTLAGQAMLKIPPGTQPGTSLRLRGQGVTDLKTRKKGDQYVKVNVEIPTRLSKKQRELLEQFAKEGNLKY